MTVDSVLCATGKQLTATDHQKVDRVATGRRSDRVAKSLRRPDRVATARRSDKNDYISLFDQPWAFP